tara:strand:+ start:505 stop:930 length:426 start_codon:yes stop_codon:yes gene_type:complete
MAKKRRKPKAQVKLGSYKYKKLPSWAATADPKTISKGLARKSKKLKKYSDIQRIEKAKKEIYRREHPYETRVADTARSISKRTVSGAGRIARRALSKRAVARKVLRKPKITVRIKEHQPAPYVPIHMKEEVVEDTRQFFFK